MQKWLRRIRGAVGLGISWGLLWGAAGLLVAVATGFDADAPFPILFTMLGFMAGMMFSGVLALTGGRRTFDQLSAPRFAGWGATGGLLLAAIFSRIASLGWGDVLVIAPTFALSSAACAAASLALARRAARDALPGAGTDDASALPRHEPRHLR